MSRLVLIAAPVHTVLTEGLTRLGYTCLHHEAIIQSQAAGLVKDCEGIITSTRLQLDRDLIDAAPALKWIGRMGSGMEVVDVPYATSKGIKCFASPEGNCNAVGEHAVGMLLSLIHRISWSYCEMRNGVWLREENRGVELEGKTVGIIGLGHTGRAFAKKLQGFRVRILAYDKYCPDNTVPDVVCCESLDAVFEEADIVSFHVPLQADTVHYFNEKFIGRMRKSFILVNTSRGRVVDTGALAEGITTGKIIGACLDVFEKEPISSMEPGIKQQVEGLMQLPNVLVTPHIAGYTHQALFKMSKVLLEKVTL